MTHETSIHQSEDPIRQIPTRVEYGEVQSGAETQAQHVVDRNPGMSPKGHLGSNEQWLTTLGEGGAVANDSGLELHMIGDFDGSANALWTLYGKEAKTHDEARIHTLKDDMDGVLIFVRPFLSVSITHSGTLMHSFTGRFIRRCPYIVRG